MLCPHCRIQFHDKTERFGLGSDIDAPDGWALLQQKCPACKRRIFHLAKQIKTKITEGDYQTDIVVNSEQLVWPKGNSRPPCPPEVPEKFSEDYTEACLVLADSQKASAALSRRCLQTLLREEATVKPSDLAREIQELLDRGTLPSHISEAIDAIRNIGNFAAHPIKSTSTGEIIPIEPGEAEWNLDVLESLFDYYFVQPAIMKKKKDALNDKLKEAGKPPMKT